MVIDLKYIGIVSGLVRNFTEMGGCNFNFSCPICGDSEKDPHKKRGFIYKKTDGEGFIYRCYNYPDCGSSFQKFLSRLDPELYKRYRLEKFLSSNKKTVEDAQTTERVKVLHKPAIPKEPAIWTEESTIAELPNTHPARQYIESREIPYKYWKILRYTDNFQRTIKRISPGSPDSIKKYPSDKRIIIPFYGVGNVLSAVQGRSLDPDAFIRYLTAKREDHKAIFGMNEVNLNETFYVLEGPFDSMFIPNAVAAASTDLDGFLDHKENAVLIFDNQPRNESVVKIMGKAVKQNWKVVVWPKSIQTKDINLIIIKEKIKAPHLLEIIKNHTYSGLRAQAEFDKWKRY